MSAASSPRGGPVFVDTNVLVYMRDSRDGDRQRRCAQWMAHLWQTRLGRISLQVLHEYYVTVTAKLTPGLPKEEAAEDLLSFRSWSPQPLTLDLTEDALDLQDRWGFSFWDSLIVASAVSQGCETLLTEDLSHGQEIGSLRIVSPFRMEP